MALTQADLDRLDQMIASGVTSMTFQDQTITFPSFEDLIARRWFVLRILTGGGASRLAATSKGV